MRVCVHMRDVHVHVGVSARVSVRVHVRVRTRVHVRECLPEKFTLIALVFAFGMFFLQ